MSHYVRLEISEFMYNTIIEYLTKSVGDLYEYVEVAELVHLIDFLEDKYQEDLARQNKEFLKNMEYEQKYKDKSLYYDENFKKIESLFEKYNLNDVSNETIFYITCEILDMFRSD